MKKVAIIIFCSTLLLFPTQIVSQKTAKQEIDKYYWFNVKLKTVIDEETKRPIINIDHLYKKVYSGTFKQYAEFYKTQLQKNNVAIGPYANKILVKKALKLYRFTNLNDEKAEEYIKAYPNDSNIYYWYFAKPVLKTNNEYQKFESNAARIAYGSMRNFLEVLHEGLGFIQFSVGPFKHELDAEKSKYIFKKYGELGYKGTEGDSELPLEIKRMTEKWKSIKINTELYYSTKNKVEAFLKYEIDFPEMYFEPNAVQVITVLVEIEGSTMIISKNNTLQGSQVPDNNPVVSYEKGRTEGYKTTFKNTGDKNITLIFKSTLITNTAIYECEDRKITIESD